MTRGQYIFTKCFAAFPYAQRSLNIYSIRILNLLLLNANGLNGRFACNAAHADGLNRHCSDGARIRSLIFGPSRISLYAPHALKKEHNPCLAAGGIAFLTYIEKKVYFIYMPITKSAAKAMRQSIKRKKQNSLKKEAYKHAIKDVKKMIASGRSEDARMILPKLYKTIDKAVKTNVLKKNTAARMKSKMTRHVNRIASAPVPPMAL